MTKKNRLAITAALFGLIMAAANAHAITIGVFSENTTAEANASAIVTGQGHVFVGLDDLTAASLAGVDVVWYMNESNGVQGQAGNAVAIGSFVNGGGIFLMNDRQVTDAETILPGGGGFNIIRDFADDQNIDVLDPLSILINGPGGIIDNTTLDGGTSSSHGFSVEGSLPGDSMLILSRTDPTEIVDFTYMFGGGAVHYSTIPLDFYMAGSGPAGVRANMVNIYATNLVAYGNALWVEKNAVPEPGALFLMGIGLALMGVMRRRRHA